MQESPPQHNEIMEEPSSQEESVMMIHWCFIPITSSDPENWTKYPSETNKIIEEAYNQHADKVDIGDSWISFKGMAQYNNKDNQRSASVKRQISRQSGLSRFTGELPKTLNEPFGEMRDFFLFLRTKASIRDIDIKVLPKGLYDDIKDIEATAKLILDSLQKEAENLEASAVKDMKFIQKPIVKSLTSKDELAFQKAIISVYTCDTFLFSQLNKKLRDEDWDNMDNLLPYILCFLNSIYIVNRKEIDDKVPWTKLYRGTKLSESMVSQYHQGRTFSWDGFTSATTNEEIVSFFQAADDNTLSVLFTISHGDWVRPKADKSEQNRYENDSFNDSIGNSEGDEYSINDDDSYYLDDEIDNDNARYDLESLQIQLYKRTDMGYDEENKNSYNKVENQKCDEKKPFISDPYCNNSEYSSTYQFDTRKDYAGQAFSIFKYSVNPDENEVIFVPGTIFKVIKTFKKDSLHCIELKISQRYSTRSRGYEKARFRSLLELELLKHDIKMKKNIIGLRSLTDLDMEKAVQALLQGKDFIDSICLDLSGMTEQSMEQFLAGLSKMPKTKVLSLECREFLPGSICDASPSLGHLARTHIKELYVMFDRETEAGFLIEKSNAGNLLKNLDILVFEINGVEDAEVIQGEEGSAIGFQDSIFSQVADSNITELQLVCGSTALELDPVALKELSKANNLKKLTLNGFAISEENVDSFILCFEKLTITHLSISLSDELEKSSLQRLLKSLLAAPSPIQALFIHFRMDLMIEIDDVIIAQISEDIAQSNLNVLELTMITITVKNLVRLIRGLSRTNLTSLYLKVQFIDESEEASSDYIPILENDLSKKNLSLLTDLFKIIPKSKLEKFGIVRTVGVMSERLLPEDLEKKLQKMLQENQIEELTKYFSHRELVFAQIPIFPDNVRDAFNARFRGVEI